MDVQHPELTVTGVAKAVDDTDRRRDVRPRPDQNGVVSEHELGFPLEHIEGVDLVLVAVRLDTLEVGPEPQLDDLELGQLNEDPVVPVPA